MILIPAIDIKSGRCVRLRQGDFLDETVFSNDPLAIAKQWIDQGAERLHIVDLDGAVNGKPVNKSTINAIAKQFPEVPIQVGGGIRDEQTIESYLGIGIEFVIVGTIAVNEPQFVKNLCQKYEGHMMVGLDARDGKIAIDGWSAFSNHDVIDFAKEFDGSGVAGIVYTDIARDGMLSGTNVEATAKLATAITTPVIASGGIRDLEDIRKLLSVGESIISGAITGRAIYEGTLQFEEANKLVLSDIGKK
ncbi:MAG: 1-(5-phosphoribosyl)-5-[(5-phosphoribosylamino)methylideneamino]imidazole-4-carboxamide isomerase [Acidiferrobacteraceae bacterium]|jgi:phosphoribosylformimino-5-aminoimidazole carboxamide ribotide isomerase|nr:1-(5-phosphoribosyl)-5-[(5-phosphoribosylamino)methylideneamino]imidazole-4-carboxamide isomerase [Acidiferrobacteraceae bacterium]|tara:strand:- start:48299 stop:49042 length:744 start_codon:yes stop_codon:yes gene_type:complete